MELEHITVSSNAGIQNYSKMEDKDKAYIIKLVVLIVGAILAGIVTGSIYSENGGVALIGFGIFFALSLGSSYFVKVKFDLDEMTDMQIFRHGIAIGLFTFMFIWVVIFNFFLF